MSATPLVPPPFHQVEGFELLFCLHESPSRVVYRARRKTDGITVVLKLAKAEHPSPTDQAKLRHEYTLLTELEVPGVVRALSLSPSRNGCALVMEDLGENTLFALLKRSSLSVDFVLETGVRLAKTLGMLHKKQLIHKDLKPQNILVDPATRTTHLIDFGIATRLRQEVLQPQPHERIEGTPAYMSPEQTGRMNRVCDSRSDLYSLGVTMYEALTGVLPFTSSDVVELVHSHIARQPMPPNCLLQSIPETVSQIVMKLLSKMPEERYASAEGVAADLEESLHQLRETGIVNPFQLGQRDRYPELRLSQKLYGRQQETQQILDAFERASAGQTELVLVAGYSGVGKSALVYEVHKPIAKQNGFFAAGKFDQLNRSVPYGPIATALRGLLRNLLCLSTKELLHWRQRLLSRLGSNWGILSDLLPELEPIVGEPLRVEQSGLLDAQHRFASALLHLCMALSAPDRPLVLFLDDLQWADTASLNLLQRLLTEPNIRNLLLIGAYRDNEVFPGHPLLLHIDEIRKYKTPIRHIVLSPLQLDHVGEFVFDSLHRDDNETRTLAEIIHNKTGGNAFYINQFMLTMAKTGVLSRNEEHQWFWDLKQIQTTMVTDNVVDLLLHNFQQMQPHTRRIISLAACIGHQFDLDTLALFHEKSAQETMSDLHESLKEGFILPLDNNYRLIPYFGTQPTSVMFQFLHDRVQQAAYALIDDTKRREVHLWNGRVMRTRYAKQPTDKELFGLVGQLNIGSPLVDDPEEKTEIARLNLLAGKKAKKATAYEAAADFLTKCIELIGDDGWEFDYEITSEAYLTLAEIEFLNAKDEHANSLLSVIDSHAQTDKDKLASLILQIILLTHQAHFSEAYQTGLRAISLSGMHWSPTFDRRQIELEMSVVARTIIEQTDWLHSNHITTNRKLQILFHMMPAVENINQEALQSLVLLAVTTILNEGLAQEAPYFITRFGAIYQQIALNQSTGHHIATLGVDLADHTKQSSHASHYVFGQSVSHWKDHLSISLRHLKRSFDESLEFGDYVHVAYSLGYFALYRLFRGDSLKELSTDIEEHCSLLDQLGIDRNLSEAPVVSAFIKQMSEQSSGLVDRTIIYARSSQEYHKFILAQIAAYFDRSWSESLGSSSLASGFCNEMSGLFSTVEHRFFRALAITAQYQNGQIKTESLHYKLLQTDAEYLSTCAQESPDNHLPRYLLVMSEFKRTIGDNHAAMVLFEKAIECAQQSQFSLLAALANELYGHFHLEWKRTKIAYTYLYDAYCLYMKCGYAKKTQYLTESFPGLFANQTTITHTTTTVAPSRSTAIAARSQLDNAAVIRAAQALSSELELSKLIERLMWVLIENAGAEKGLLVLNRNGILHIEARISLNPNAVHTGISTPAAESNLLPQTLVRYVERAKETTILDNATFDSRFASDPYIVRTRPKSILCLPMIHKARLVGILYLENNLATNIFAPDNVELLQLISVQAAIAIENAMLYADLRVATEKLRDANENLERQVAVRTQELKRALQEIWSEMDLARKIQTVLLPQKPILVGYDFGALTVPADTVGGDYYDVFQTNGQNWLLIGDVSGHGVPAGLIMMMAQTAVQTVAHALDKPEQPLSPSELLVSVNQILRKNIQTMRRSDYMTLLCMKISSHKISFAGMHQDILIYRAATQTVERIETAGVWMGFVDDASGLFENGSLSLSEDDAVLLFTDGITEARLGGQLLSTEGLVSVFCELASHNMAAQDLIGSLWERLRNYQINDDVTLVALKKLPTGYVCESGFETFSTMR